jgi:hypothetical protein
MGEGGGRGVTLYTPSKYIFATYSPIPWRKEERKRENKCTYVVAAGAK